jgi:hypothetical protein
MLMKKNIVTNLLFSGKMSYNKINNKYIIILFFCNFLFLECAFLEFPKYVDTEYILYDYEMKKLQEKNDKHIGYNRNNCPELRSCKNECSTKFTEQGSNRHYYYRKILTEKYFYCEQECYGIGLCDSYVD